MKNDSFTVCVDDISKMSKKDLKTELLVLTNQLNETRKTQLDLKKLCDEKDAELKRFEERVSSWRTDYMNLSKNHNKLHFDFLGLDKELTAQKIVNEALVNALSKPTKNDPDSKYVVIDGVIYKIAGYHVNKVPGEIKTAEVYAESADDINLKDEIKRLSDSSSK